MLTLLVVMLTAQVGCSKDTDCKGDRICEAGRCVSPAPPTPPPEVTQSAPDAEPPRAPPLVPSSPPRVVKRASADDNEYPKVVRREGQVCVQSLEPDGSVSEACRGDAPQQKRAQMDAASEPVSSYDFPAETNKRRRRAGLEPDAERRWSRFVADFSFGGGLIGGVTTQGSYVFGGVDAYLFVGGRFVEGFGLGAAVDETLLIGRGGVVSLTTFGPGFRLGRDVHVTLTPGASVVSGVGVFGVAFAFLLHIAIPVAGGFGFHFNTGVIADASGAFLPLTFGIGGSIF